MIILASNSPRRKELLSKIVDDFKVVPSSIEESLPDNIDIVDSAEFLATKKAMDIFKSYPSDVVIGADTIVVLNDKIYGKPKSKEEAREMLQALSNNKHLVITGVCVVSSKNSLSFSSVSEVEFFNLSEEEIEEYLNDEEYKDKAGSYAIQGKASLFIKKINGDYNGIIGLPISMLNKVLKSF